MPPEIVHVICCNDDVVAVTTDTFAHAELILAQLREKDFNNIREKYPWAGINTMDEYMACHHWHIREAPLL